MSNMAGSDASYLFETRRRAKGPVVSPEKDPDRTTACVTASQLLCENVLSHPFTILRKQCQVHVRSGRYHLVPITLFSPCYTMQQRQGVAVYWKGLGSAVFVRGFTLGVEDFLSKVTPWPKEINSRSTLKGVGQHFLLKCVSAAAATPFVAASLVEIVQSDIASEKPGVFDVFKEGFFRLVSWTTPQTGRLLPIWVLILPSTITYISRYIFSLVATGISEKVFTQLARKSYEKYGLDVSESGVAQSPLVQLGSWFAGRAVSDIVLYPVETVLQRLYLQGTRTIIDNLDDGMSVVPIVTRYEGFWDCWRSITGEEGILGLYKGFGSLLLQYGAEFLFLRAVHFLITDVYGSRFRSGAVISTPPRTPERPEVDPGEIKMEPRPSTSFSVRDGGFRTSFDDTMVPAPRPSEEPYHLNHDSQVRSSRPSTLLISQSRSLNFN